MTNTEIISVDNVNGVIKVNCANEFTAPRIQTIKTVLLQNAAHAAQVILSLKNVTAIDITGLQFLYAWKKALAASGGTVHVVLPDNEYLKDLLVKTGVVKLL